MGRSNTPNPFWILGCETGRHVHNFDAGQNALCPPAANADQAMLPHFSHFHPFDDRPIAKHSSNSAKCAWSFPAHERCDFQFVRRRESIAKTLDCELNGFALVSDFSKAKARRGRVVDSLNGFFPQHMTIGAHLLHSAGPVLSHLRWPLRCVRCVQTFRSLRWGIRYQRCGYNFSISEKRSEHSFCFSYDDSSAARGHLPTALSIDGPLIAPCTSELKVALRRELQSVSKLFQSLDSLKAMEKMVKQNLLKSSLLGQNKINGDR